MGSHVETATGGETDCVCATDFAVSGTDFAVCVSGSDVCGTDFAASCPSGCGVLGNDCASLESGCASSAIGCGCGCASSFSSGSASGSRIWKACESGSGFYSCLAWPSPCPSPPASPPPLENRSSRASFPAPLRNCCHLQVVHSALQPPVPGAHCPLVCLKARPEVHQELRWQVRPEVRLVARLEVRLEVLLELLLELRLRLACGRPMGYPVIEGESHYACESRFAFGSFCALNDFAFERDSCVHGSVFASEKDFVSFAMGSGVDASRCDPHGAWEDSVFAMGCVFFVTGCVSFATGSAFGKGSAFGSSQARARSVARQLDPTLPPPQRAPPPPLAAQHLAVPGPMRLRCPVGAPSAEVLVVLRNGHLLRALQPEAACRIEDSRMHRDLAGAWQTGLQEPLGTGTSSTKPGWQEIASC